MVRAKSIYQPAEHGDGFRLLVMRRWPRGVRKEAVHAWDRELGPSPSLLAAWRSHRLDWAGFSGGYGREMAAHQERLKEMARLAERETVTLLCSCRDEEHCHRSLLKRLIQEAG